MRGRATAALGFVPLPDDELLCHDDHADIVMVQILGRAKDQTPGDERQETMMMMTKVMKKINRQTLHQGCTAARTALTNTSSSSASSAIGRRRSSSWTQAELLLSAGPSWPSLMKI